MKMPIAKAIFIRTETDESLSSDLNIRYRKATIEAPAISRNDLTNIITNAPGLIRRGVENSFIAASGVVDEQ